MINEGYNAMGNDGRESDQMSDGSGYNQEGMDPTEARCLYASDMRPDERGSRADTRSRRSRSTHARSVGASSKASSQKSRQSDKQSDHGSRASRRSGK